MKKKFIVTGMTCSACSASVEKTVKKLNGVNEVNVNLLANTMTVDYDDSILSHTEIISSVLNAGYNASLENDSLKDSNTKIEKYTNEFLQMKKRILISFIFMIPLMYISMGHMMGLPIPSFINPSINPLAFAFTQFILTLPIIYVNFKFFTVGFRSLIKKSPNMDTLIAIGSSASMFYGIYIIYTISYYLSKNSFHMAHEHSMNLYFESAAMILTLITLGKFLEAKSKSKTTEAVSKLMDLAPKTARVYRNNKESIIPINEVAINDIVIVKPGESIPIDGIILEGTTSIDESAITGESIPVEKKINDKVVAATINKNGYIKIKTLKIGNDTTLAQIIKLVEDASSSKAPIAKLADKVSGIFVPIVITISLLSIIIWLLLGYSFDFALSIGISVLVISCPCALGLATPVAIMVGTGKGAELGILIKTGESLEIAHNLDTIVMDKTGTITEGKPIVTDIIPFNEISNIELLTIAASLEKPSEHPLSEAIINKATENKIKFLEVTNFISITGKGIEATINTKKYIAGNIRFITEKNILINDYMDKYNSLAEEGKTPLLFADENNLIGIIAVADMPKPSSKEAIELFQQTGMEVIMLTGDNLKTAEAIKKKLGIKKIIAEVLPGDKEFEIRKLQDSGKKVAMIGDGINDAPALTRADVGIAIGAGTDIAIDCADIILMKNDLLDAVTSINLSKSTIRNIKENLFWAFIYNIIGIPIACGILYPIFNITLNPMIAATLMSFSSVSVVSNALRLKRFNNKKIHNKGEINMNYKKTIKIEGMMCNHCTGRVDKVLNNVEGVTAIVSLEDKSATVTSSKELSNDYLTKLIEDEGYKVISIE